jgi:ABC-type transport system involved in cytochrome bd biosynthesis fused ATPase/permease subunit
VGEKRLCDLRAISAEFEIDGHILLLDEWDANLDQANREILNAKIDQLAKRNLVIEVRHI